MVIEKTILPLMLLALLNILGCGGPDKRAEVSGTVRLNGQPLASGSIAFVPTVGNTGPSSGGVITDGRYSVPRTKGVAIGKNRVSILSTVKTGRKIDIGRSDLQDEWLQVVPAKYNEQSEIVCDIKPGSNQQDFDLKGEPPRP
jgi:hypothetical protein